MSDPLALLTEEERSKLVSRLRDWLGTEGIDHFRDLKRRGAGKKVQEIILSIPINGGGSVPWVVHYRDGMRVRNFLREQTDDGWTAHEYDDRWGPLVEMAIRES